MAREGDTADTGGVVLDNDGGVVVPEIVQDHSADQGDQGGAQPDDGLSAEDRAAFDAMRSGTEVVAGAEPGPEGAEGAEGGKKSAAEGGGEEDGDDDGADGAESGGENKRRSRVSWNKHQRELRERDEKIAALEAAGRTNAEMQARLDERMKIINEALTPKEKEELTDDDPEPDPDSEIFEHNKWLRRQLGKTNEALRQLNDSLTQQGQQTEVERSYVNDFHRFSQQEPQFGAAYNFLMNSRKEELARYYFDKDIAPGEDGKPPEQLTPAELAKIAEVVESEEMTLVQTALTQKRSPAQRIFNMARARGFRPTPVQKPADTNGAKKVNGEAPGSLAAADSAAAKPDVREEVRRIKSGVEASASLSSGGGAPARTVTPKMIADMDQDEFNDLVTRLGGTDSLAVKQLLGGA